MRQLPSGYSGQLVTHQAADGVDVADVVRTVRGQWRALIAFLVLGIVAAGAVILFAPRRFEGTATLLARASGGEGGASILGRLTSAGGMMAGGALGGLPAPFESELQVLRSRAVAGRVVDSLELQFSVRSPAGLPPTKLIAGSDLPGRFKPRKYQFARATDGRYTTKHGDQTFSLTPGQPGRIDIGSVTLQRTTLPAAFTVKVFDREDAISRVAERLEANKAGGEVARVVYRGEDSLTAAIVPNLVVAYYLERRKTVDRGTNQRRLEYVTEQYETTARELAATERELRDYQESSGVLDAGMVGQAWLEGAVALRESLTTVLVNERSISHLVDRATTGSLTPRDLAAYPAFLTGTSMNTLGSTLAELEAQRFKLLERRTERDPEVVALDQNIKSLETQILSMARSYANSITQNRIGLSEQLDTLQKRMLVLPAAAERGGRLQRDVFRLTTIYTALQAQLVEARLAAIGEGGEVRQIDAAEPPRKPAFPKPWLTMGIGTLGGLITGTIAALLLGWFGRWLRDPVEIERATGVAAQRLESQSPLLLSGAVPRTLLVLPIGDRAQTAVVAQRLAHTASARALRTKVLDLTNGNGHSGGESGDLSSLIDRLEKETDFLIVQLPAVFSDASIASLRETRPTLLVAPPGPVDRALLGNALDMLRRMGVPCAGVVISETERRSIIRG